MSVPPGVSERDFERALARFRSVVGADWVFTSDEDVALYRDAYSPLWSEPEEKVASAAVGPESAEQVQEIVRIANEFRVPLYPISTGRNLGYGGSAPVLSGSVVLDLKRMNRILEVDERNAYALVEPGVSYFDLYRHIEERGLKLWIDCPDPGWGSIVGNALDHGVGYTMNPYRDHWGAQCGLEAVTGDGELVRTGMGALPGSRTWQQFKYGYGPYLDGMFSQSNFGVVTKMGVWLMPQPETYVDCSVDVFAHDDIIPLVDHMNYLMNTGLQNAGTNLQSPLRFAVAGNPELRAALASDAPADIAKLDAFSRERQVPFYSNVFKFYGPEEVVRAQMEYTRRRLLTIPGARFREGAFYRFPDHGRAEGRSPRSAGSRHPDARDVLDRRALEFCARDARTLGLLARDSDARRGRHRVAASIPARAPGVRHGRRAARVPAVLSSAHVRHPLHVLCDARSCLQPGRAPHVRAARRSRRGARLGRVPHAHGLHGPVRGSVLVQRPRAAKATGEDQRRRRSERHPVRGPLRHLAEASPRRVMKRVQ